MNIAGNLSASAAEHGANVAFKLDDIELTYAQLDGASMLVAGLLKDKGIQPGDRVGIMLPNVPYFPVVYYGILRAGAIVVPLNVLLKGREVRFYCEDSGAKVLFAWGDFGEAAEQGTAEIDTELVLVKPGEFEQLLGAQTPAPEVVERDDEDGAVILYTSGTTGTPKGAELRHGNIASNLTAVTNMFEVNSDDVFFGGLPLFHSFGQTCAMNTAIQAGATVTLLPKFEPTKALEIIQRDKVTIFQGVPTMYVAMVNDPSIENVDASTVRFCVSGGASLPVQILDAVESKLGARMLEGYGLSETSPVASFNQPDRPAKAGSIGTPIPGVEMRVVDDERNPLPQGEVGEIQIKGPNVMRGYWKRPDATAEVIDADGWFSTGDMARVDEEGYFFIVDRKKDMIIRGGYNVYPREIEEVIYEHPAVLEAAVIGFPHDVHGEEVCAVIALKPGQQAGEDEIIEFTKERVAAYKYPRKVIFRDELPKGPTGKIMKREIEIPSEALTD